MPPGSAPGYEPCSPTSPTRLELPIPANSGVSYTFSTTEPDSRRAWTTTPTSPPPPAPPSKQSSTRPFSRGQGTSPVRHQPEPRSQACPPRKQVPASGVDVVDGRRLIDVGSV